MKKYLSAMVLVLGLTLSVAAQDMTRRADVRETTQRVRIRQGRANGQVTRTEARALNHEQRKVKRTERRAKADGTVSLQEKRRLERKQDRASRHIRRAKHNLVAQ